MPDKSKENDLKNGYASIQSWHARRPWPRWLYQLTEGVRSLSGDVQRSNLFQRASSMAYMTIFSLVPSLVVTFAIVSVFQPITDPNAQWFDEFRILVLRNLAPDTGANMISYLQTFLANIDVAKIGMTSFAGLLVSLLFLLDSIETALNDVWLVSKTRSFFKRFLFFWSFCTLGAFLFTITLGILAKFDWHSLIAGAASSQLGAFPSVVTSVFTTFVFFVFLYKIGPNCHVRWKAAAIGAAVATILIRISSLIFKIYSSNNDFYTNAYGALAALPLFLLWLYIGWVGVLFGAIVAWRVQHGFALKTATASTFGD